MQLNIMLVAHMKRGARFAFTAFLLGNRCPPDLIVEWLKKRKCLRDQSACHDVAGMLERHKRGTLKKKVYMLNFRVVDKSGYPVPETGDEKIDNMFPLEPLSHAFLHEEGWRWDQSVALLRASQAHGIFCKTLAGPALNAPPKILISPVFDPDELPSGSEMYGWRGL